jgi:DNA topoisomerase-1
MLHNAKEYCRQSGLRYVETSELCLRRRRCGKGFAYLDAGGRTIRNKALKARLKRLAIPPAWTEVCIAEAENAHIQAIGQDSEGRLQYIYHPKWQGFREAAKERRLLRFGSALPRVRKAVRRELASPGLSRTKIVAAVVRLIDRALLRPGHEEYARREGGRGAATLLKSDVQVEGETVVIAFEGKSGKEVRQEISDPLLARVLRRLARLPGLRLFGAAGGDRERPVTARDVNEFLIEAGGTAVSAKDFRTFSASASALAYLAEQDGLDGERARAKEVLEAAEKASEKLANTRTVARSSYIHPGVIEAYQRGKLKASLLRGRVRNGLTRMETALVRFLEKNSS